jgi:hypothetical protein
MAARDKSPLTNKILEIIQETFYFRKFDHVRKSRNHKAPYMDIFYNKR